MGRPKEFERNAVIDIAIEVFRRQGYEVTSVQDLVDAMGINRASLYDTFGDKHALYLAALDQYDARNYAARSALFEQGLPIREAVALLYRGIIDELMSSGGASFGCLIINSSVERACLDPEIAARAERNWNMSMEMYLRALRIARDAGEFISPKSDDDLLALARFIGATVRGLRVTAKASCCRETLEDIARIGLTVFDH